MNRINKKPFYNAILAAGYITLIVSFMNWITSIPHAQEDNIFMPMAMIALLVLSVSVMAFLFFYQPLLLLLDGKRPEALKLFFGTVGVFAIFTLIFMTLAMFISRLTLV